MSDIIDFYSGKKGNFRSLNEVRSFSNEQMENIHNYIQWLFPLAEPSKYNPEAPILTFEDIIEFNNNKNLRAEVYKSIRQFMLFLYNNENIWLCSSNHNHLRISRMLKFLMLNNMMTLVVSILDELSCITWNYKEEMDNVLTYWNNIIFEEYNKSESVMFKNRNI